MALRPPVLCEPDVAFAPDQAPEPAHEVALVELQDSVEAVPEMTELGLAVNDTVGAVGLGVTETVVDCVADPPAPVQVSEYVALLVKAPVLCEPEVPFVPDHVPEAVHEVAFVELQESVAEAPDVPELGLEDIATVGAVGLGVEVATLLIWYTRITGAQLLSLHTAETKSL